METVVCTECLHETPRGGHVYDASRYDGQRYLLHSVKQPEAKYRQWTADLAMDGMPWLFPTADGLFADAPEV